MTITLVGGPADGLKVEWKDGNLLKWVPQTEHEKVTARMHNRPLNGDPITYRRSLRSKSLFVYQP